MPINMKDCRTWRLIPLKVSNFCAKDFWPGNLSLLLYMNKLRNVTSVVTNNREKTWKTTLIEHIQELHFYMINVRKLFQKRVLSGRTFSLWMKHFSSSATNPHSRGTLNDIYKSICSGYWKSRVPNVSCVMTCLLKRKIIAKHMEFDTTRTID